MATYSRILAWRILQRSPLESMESKRVGHDWGTNTFTFIVCQDLGVQSLCTLSCFSHVQLFATLWIVCSLPGSSVQGFSWQEYWSGLPCHPPGNLPDSRIEPEFYAAAALQASSLLLSHQIELIVLYLKSLQYKWRIWMFKQIEYDGVSTRMQY